MPQINASKYLILCGWQDVPHLDAKTKAELLESTPPHLRDARAKGIPTMGSGRIFPIDEDAIKCDAFPIPPHWPRIAGMDIGWDHPNAVMWLAWDRDTDTIYLTDEHAASETGIDVHAAAIKRRGDWIPVAWPGDANQPGDRKSGVAIADLYRQEGVAMLPELATFPQGHTINGQDIASRTSLEAGVMEMLLRMQQGRWKVFRHLEGWFSEFRLYHRKDGKIVRLLDDRLSASRYAMMMLRFAKTPPSSPRKHRDARRARAGNWKTR